LAFFGKFGKIKKNTLPIDQEEIYSNFQYTKALALTGKVFEKVLSPVFGVPKQRLTPPRSGTYCFEQH
jgi:hypothetical protein